MPPHIPSPGAQRPLYTVTACPCAEPGLPAPDRPALVLVYATLPGRALAVALADLDETARICAMERGPGGELGRTRWATGELPVPEHRRACGRCPHASTRPPLADGPARIHVPRDADVVFSDSDTPAP